MAKQVQVCNVVIKQDGKYLLVQESKLKAYKLWNLPGGHADDGEMLEQAAIREAYEETGYTVTILERLVSLPRPQDGVVLNAYRAQITAGSLQLPPEEILDARWFAYEEIMTMKNLRDREYITSAVKADKR